jgi:murein DD-endopeptidase MepM/ murein hydrolase activator NlpD
LVSEIEELRDRVAGQRTQLVALQRESQRRRDDRGEELERYVSLEQQRQRALRQTQANQRIATTRLDSLAREEEELAELIARLEEARRRAVAAGAPDEATITTASLGTLPWPVDGDVVYPYGRYAGPDGTILNRQGIGIRVPLGTPVRAVAGGTVAYARPYGTYGQTVILQHGGGFMTLYLYLSEPRVAEGEYVLEGTVIGLSGGSATDVGPHVEFQIRQGSERSSQVIALDPETWLRRR